MHLNPVCPAGTPHCLGVDVSPDAANASVYDGNIRYSISVEALLTAASECMDKSSPALECATIEVLQSEAPSMAPRSCRSVRRVT